MKKTGLLVVLVTALLLTGITLTAPAPVAADSDIVHDRSRDVPAWMDIVKLRGTNGQRKVRVALHLRDLQYRGKIELGVSWRTGDSVGYAFFVRIRHTDDGLRAVYKHSKTGGDTDPAWTCGENHGVLAYRPHRDRIILTVPHGCLRAYDGIRVINDWAVYGQTHRYHRSRLQFDSLRTGRLSRG